MGIDVGDAFADRIRSSDDIGGQLLFQVSVTYFAFVPLLIEVLHGFRCGYDLHDGEEVLDVVWFWGIWFAWSLVGQGFFHLLLDGLRIICQIDAVAFRFAHLAAAVQPWYLDRLRAVVVGYRFLEVIHFVEIVESFREVAGHLQVLELVFAHRHLVRIVDKDIRRHQGRVGEESCVHVLWLFPRFVLERNCLRQLSEIGVHVEHQIELHHFRHIALDEDGRLLWVQPAGKILCQNALHVRIEDVGVWMRCQGVVVCYEEETTVVLLHAYKIL